MSAKKQKIQLSKATAPEEFYDCKAIPKFPVPDTSKKKRKADLWCPYCGEWTKFKLGLPCKLTPDMPSWWKRCVGCGIGIEDFWVKRANHLWK